MPAWKAGSWAPDAWAGTAWDETEPSFGQAWFETAWAPGAWGAAAWARSGATTPPGVPLSLATAATSGTTATTTWVSGGGTATGYQVQIAPVSTGVYADAVGTQGAFSFAHTGLPPYTPHTTRVRALGTPNSDWAISAVWWTDNTGSGGGELATALAPAVESDAAVNLLLATALQVAEETDRAFNRLLVNLLQLAVESDQAVPLNLVGELQAGEQTDRAFNLPLVLQVQPAFETDSAVPLLVSVMLQPAVEADQAESLLLLTPGTLQVAEETDQAVGLVLISPVVLGIAVETDVAVTLLVSGGAPPYASQPTTASSWSYKQTATLWALTGRADWSGARSFASPVLFLCDYMRDQKMAVTARGDEFVSKLTVYTSLPGIKQGDMVLLGISGNADPVATDAEEVQAVVAYADTFNAGGPEDFKVLA